jgi:hypothetical protein
MMGPLMSKKPGSGAVRTSPRQRKPVKRSSGGAWVLPSIVGVAAVAVLIVLVLLARSGGSQPNAGASPSLTGMASGQTVDGIKCDTNEQVLYHIHAHLAIFANGQEQQVPQGIGIPDPQVQQTVQGPFVASGKCFYWLHSHATDGIIHIEAPEQRTFTLGNFFDIWGQPLSSTQVAQNHGAVIAYANGQKYDGDPRSIPLNAHSVIQLDVGTDVPFRQYSFPSNY